MPVRTYGEGASFGPDGRLYITGGSDLTRPPPPPGGDVWGCLTSVYVYTPGQGGQRGSWSSSQPLPFGRYGHASVTGPDGRVYVIGANQGCTYGGETGAGGYALKTDGSGTWEPVAPMLNYRSYFGAATGPDGLIYATGFDDGTAGYDPTRSKQTAEAYNTCTGAWTPVTPMTIPRRLDSAVVGPDGRVYVLGGGRALGGFSDPDPSASVEAYTTDPGMNVCPKASIDDLTVTEPSSGTAPARFTVSLDRPAVKPITIDYQTSDGTAKAGSDYTATSGTLTFAAGQTSATVPDPSGPLVLPTAPFPGSSPVPELSKTIDVPIRADTDPEPAERFTVKLSAPAGTVMLAKAEGTGTILDAGASPAATTTTTTDPVLVPSSTTSTTLVSPTTLANPVTTITTVPLTPATTTTAPTVDPTTPTTNTTVPATTTTTVPSTTTTTAPPGSAPSTAGAAGTAAPSPAGAAPSVPAQPQNPPPPRNPDPLNTGADPSQPSPPSPVSQVAPVLVPLVQPTPPPPPPATLSQSIPEAQAQSQGQAQQQAQSQSQQQAQQQSQAQAQQQVQAAAQPAMMEERERQAEVQQARATETGNQGGSQTHMASARRRPAAVPPVALAWVASLAAPGMGLVTRNGERGPAPEPVRGSASRLAPPRQRRRRRSGPR